MKFRQAHDKHERQSLDSEIPLRSKSQELAPCNGCSKFLNESRKAHFKISCSGSWMWKNLLSRSRELGPRLPQLRAPQRMKRGGRRAEVTEGWRDDSPRQRSIKRTQPYFSSGAVRQRSHLYSVYKKHLPEVTVL